MYIQFNVWGRIWAWKVKGKGWGLKDQGFRLFSSPGPSQYIFGGHDCYSCTTVTEKTQPCCHSCSCHHLFFSGKPFVAALTLAKLWTFQRLNCWRIWLWRVQYWNLGLKWPATWWEHQFCFDQWLIIRKSGMNFCRDKSKHHNYR